MINTSWALKQIRLILLEMIVFLGNYFCLSLREIDCSLALVGEPAVGTESRGKSIHLPHI